jgi:Fe-Mn family superoxide dismutase
MSHQLCTFDVSRVQGLSRKALDLHLGLYKGYVDNLNQLLEQTANKSSPPAGLAADGYARRFAFEYNGVALHELFFEALTGQKGSASGGFGAALSAFGGFEGWKNSVESLGKTRGVEHAFMIDFAPSQRADYMRIVLDNVDWAVIDSRYQNPQ